VQSASGMGFVDVSGVTDGNCAARDLLADGTAGVQHHRRHGNKHEQQLPERP
jgi:hypothetical protein